MLSCAQSLKNAECVQKKKKNGDTSIMITVPPTNLKAKTQTENQWMQMQCVQQKSLHHETAFK